MATSFILQFITYDFLGRLGLFSLAFIVFVCVYRINAENSYLLSEWIIFLSLNARKEKKSDTPHRSPRLFILNNASDIDNIQCCIKTKNLTVSSAVSLQKHLDAH